MMRTHDDDNHRVVDLKTIAIYQTQEN